MVYLLLGARWALALVLIAFSAQKLLMGSVEKLTADVARYGVLPKLALRPVATVLPWLELVIGLCLAFGVMLIPAAALAAALMAAFAGAIAWHLSRGHQFGCGCGAGSMISWSIVLRDLALCAAAVAIVIGPSSGLSAWAGWGTVPVAVPSRTLLPVPLLTILAIVCARMIVASRPAMPAHVVRTALPGRSSVSSERAPA